MASSHSATWAGTSSVAVAFEPWSEAAAAGVPIGRSVNKLVKAMVNTRSASTLSVQPFV